MITDKQKLYNYTYLSIRILSIIIIVIIVTIYVDATGNTYIMFL